MIDEYGGTAGILTLEDLVEALVGPMRNEASGVGEADQAPQVVHSEDGSALLDGLLRLEEFEEATHLRLAGEDHEEVETIGGLFQTRLGRIPVVGDEIAVAGRTLRVDTLDGLRVAVIRLLPLDSENVNPDHGSGYGSASVGTGSQH